MSKSTTEPWDKPRSHGTHLTDAEVEFMTKALKDGRTPQDIARELKCASRTVYAHRARMNGLESSYGPPKTQRPAPKSRTVGRFYKSDFVPS